MMKKCTQCKVTQPLSEFNKNKSRVDGLQGECKTCRKKTREAYRKTIDGLISQIHGHQKFNSKRRGYVPPNYSRNELKTFALASPTFMELYDKWVESDYDAKLSPSFDRKDDYKPYTFENFNEWMPWYQNNQKGNDDRRTGKNTKLTNPVVRFNTITGEEKNYHSGLAASRDNIVSSYTILEECKGRKKSSGTYKWYYKK